MEKEQELTMEGLKSLITGEIGKSVEAILKKESEGMAAQFKKEIAEEIEKLKKPVDKKDIGGGEGAGDPAGSKVEKHFKSFGEQAQTIYKFGGSDSRLQAINKAASGLGDAVPSDGGFLVQQDFAAELLRRMYDIGSVMGKCRKIPISATSNGLKIPYIDETSRADGSRLGGVRGYWANEADSPTKSKTKIGRLTIDLEKLMAVCYVTDELLADSTALEALLRESYTEEMNFKVEDAIINGTGAGQPLGILNSPCLVTVAKENAQPAATILFQNILKMYARMWARSRANAVWLISQDIEAQLYSMSLTGTAGGVFPVYLPPNGLSGNPYGTLFGRPVLPIEYAQTLGTVGDIILADLSQYLLIDKGGIQANSSMHVRFLNDEMAYRFTYRTNGQPTWQAPLAPKNSANTQSPFVALATRA